MTATHDASAIAAKAFSYEDAPLSGLHMIEASAGTGKTWTMVSLCVRVLLETDTPIQSILVVTFTKVAVAELKGRLHRKLLDAQRWLSHAALPSTTLTPTSTPDIDDETVIALIQGVRARTGQGDDVLLRKIERALHAFDEASVFTIHSFCQQAINDAAFSALEPTTLELAGDEHSPLLHQALADAWRHALSAATPSTALLTALVDAKVQPLSLARHLQTLLKLPLASVRWPDALASNAALDGASGAFLALHARAQVLWLHERASIRASFDAAVNQSLKVGRKQLQPTTIDKTEAAWDAWLKQAHPSSRPANLGDLERFDRTQFSSAAPTQPTHAFFELAGDLLASAKTLDSVECQAVRAFMRRVLEDAAARVRALKRLRRVISHDDVLRRTHERLTDDAVNHASTLATRLRHRYPVALIDEFQDTDALQLAIFKLMGQGTEPSPTLGVASVAYFVGDPKQAIYNFRGADLPSYLDAKAHANSVGTLLHNQRSTPELLRALNALFTRNSHLFIEDGLDYTSVAVGVKPRPVFVDRRAAEHEQTLSSTTAALTIWSLPPNDVHGQSMSHAAARRAAIAATATDIASLLFARPRVRSDARPNHANPDDHASATIDGRALEGGDIAVIVRNHAQVQAMREALMLHGIASVTPSSLSVYQTNEAEELAAWLHAVVDPTRGSLLRTALATQALGVDANDLALWVQHERAAGAEPAMAEPEATRLQDLTNAWTERMHAWHARWLSHGVAAMLLQAFDTVGLAARLLPLPDGERRLTNWLHLMELLNTAASEDASPQALLRWFDARRADRSSSDESLLRLESDRALVKIMTIHGSKGLEFPIVYAPCLYALGGYSRTGDLLGARYHPKSTTKSGNHATQVIDFATGLEATHDETVKEAIKLESDAEDLRLIYVTLTRAVHRVVLVVDAHSRGHSSDKHKSLRSLLNWVIDGGGSSSDIQGWREWKAAAAPQVASRLVAAWKDLADGAAPTVVILEVPADVASHVPFAQADRQTQSTRDATSAIAAWKAPGPIRPDWQRASASRWMGELAAVEPSDHTTTRTDSDDAPANDFNAFPRGARAGDAVHAMIERASFSDASSWPAAAHAALRKHPQANSLDETTLAAQLVAMMGALTTTPLRLRGAEVGDAAFTMSALESGQRRNEWAFDMHLGHEQLGRLLVWMQGQGLSVAGGDTLIDAAAWTEPTATKPATRERLVRGFVDMVFEHDGRFYLVDWKSNHLGDHAGDYAPSKLEQAMVIAGYHLQHVVYAIALHRHLQTRLRRLNVDDVWGGAMVVFLRGLQGATPSGQAEPTGVYQRRLSSQALDEAATTLGLAPFVGPESTSVDDRS